MAEVERENRDDEGGVLTLVCVTCGQEYYFASSQPPAEMICEKCGHGDCQECFSAASGDYAAEDVDATSGRGLDAHDAEGDTLPRVVLDLNRDWPGVVHSL